MKIRCDFYTLLCLTKGFPLTEEDAQELRDWAEERADILPDKDDESLSSRQFE